MNRMLDQNPMRIDFYERYQEIIEDYNNGKEYANIIELFNALMALFSDLSEEEKRAERELLDEDELTVFDMLNRDKKITDKEKFEVKDKAYDSPDNESNCSQAKAPSPNPDSKRTRLNPISLCKNFTKSALALKTCPKPCVFSPNAMISTSFKVSFGTYASFVILSSPCLSFFQYPLINPLPKPRQ